MANRETLGPGGHQSFAAAIFTKIKTLLAGKQDTLTFDAAPTPGSQNPVTSSGVASAINALTASDVGALPDDQIVPITLGGTGNADGYIRTGLRAGTTAGSKATAEGNYNRASGRYSHAEGTQNDATHDASHAEGQSTSATALYAHAEGYSTRATRQAAHAEGYSTYASGNFSHAEGQSAAAYGASAHAEGTGTNASGENQHAGGKWNVVDNANTYAEIIGNGTGANARSNARTLDWAGNSWQAGKATVGANAVNDMDLPPLSQVRQMIGSGDGAPVGTVIFFAGLSAPNGYLACDGTEYNITDYQGLADFIADNYGSVNYFGGDGADTFCVPDWQGEFFRAAGPNSRANQGSGGAVGEHQDGTSAPLLAIDGRETGSPKLGYYADDSVAGFAAVSNADKGAVAGGSALSFQRVNVDSKQTTSSRSNFYTSRPTNTSLLVCIKAV